MRLAINGNIFWSSYWGKEILIESPPGHDRSYRNMFVRWSWIFTLIRKFRTLEKKFQRSRSHLKLLTFIKLTRAISPVSHASSSSTSSSSDSFFLYFNLIFFFFCCFPSVINKARILCYSTILETLRHTRTLQRCNYILDYVVDGTDHIYFIHQIP